MSEIKVSIVCNTFNHEEYVRDALEGFITQKTNFPFEVLVHDDASIDGTAKIIKEYEVKYPDIIKPIYQKENQYSKGIRINSEYQLPRSRGKYIAMCEGDDYWTDPYKLQKQFDVMEAHPEVDMCAHGVIRVQADTNSIKDIIAPLQESGILTAEQVIMGEGGYLGTNSLFFKKDILVSPPRFRTILPMDYTLQILGSLRGGIYYIAENLSVYRWLTKGGWTESVQFNRERQQDFNIKKRQMLEQLDIDTKQQYSDIINERIKLNDFYSLEKSDNCKALLGAQYRSIYRRLPVKNRFIILIKACFPALLKAKRHIEAKR